MVSMYGGRKRRHRRRKSLRSVVSRKKYAVGGRRRHGHRRVKRRVGGKRQRRMTMKRKKMMLLRRLKRLGMKKGLRGRGLWDWLKERGRDLGRLAIDKGLPALGNLAIGLIKKRIGLGRRRKHRRGRGKKYSIMPVRTRLIGSGRRRKRKMGGMRRRKKNPFKGGYTLYGGRRRGVPMASWGNMRASRKTSHFA